MKLMKIFGNVAKIIIESVLLFQFASISVSAKPSALRINFDDLDAYSWAYPSISRLCERGIIDGYSEKIFAPGDMVKREEFVKMLVCAMELENEDYGQNIFTDLDGSWAEKYVNIAYRYGIVTGDEESVFGREEKITRQDMAVMIFRAMCKNGYMPNDAKNEFNDKELCADYANQAIGCLADIGIITGTGYNDFSPKAYSTRAEAAVILDRAMSYLVQTYTLEI